MVVSVGLNAIQARSVQQMFRKLNNEAQDEIKEMLIDIAADETFATIKRMEAKSKGQGDIYDRVADVIDFDYIDNTSETNPASTGDQSSYSFPNKLETLVRLLIYL